MAQKKETETRDAVTSVIGEIEKEFGKGAIMFLDDGVNQVFDVIPSGCVSLNRALGIQGYPRGRIVEIFGPESSGKTTLSLHAIAEVQRRGGIAAFIDAEHAFDVRYARALGVDTAKLLISQPDDGEQALEIADLLTRSGSIDLIVVDSVAALVPRAELQGDMGDAHMGLHARLMSQALRKLTAVGSKTDTTFIFINQLRQKIGVVFGNPETTTGGNALKFYASVRLDVRRVGKVALGEETIGSRTRVKVVKNKCAQPFAEAEFDIRWGTGIDAYADLLDVAVEAGVVQKNGSHYAFGGEALGQGREKVRELLSRTPALEQGIQNALAGPTATPSVAGGGSGAARGAAQDAQSARAKSGVPTAQSAQSAQSTSSVQDAQSTSGAQDAQITPGAQGAQSAQDTSNPPGASGARGTSSTSAAGGGTNAQSAPSAQDGKGASTTQSAPSAQDGKGASTTQSARGEKGASTTSSAPSAPSAKPGAGNDVAPGPGTSKTNATGKKKAA